jgi:RNA polymerase sigma-70 factor (ECF subfamily)
VIAGELRPARINGLPGAVLISPDGPQTFTFEPGEDGKLAAIYIMRNPDKLTRVGSRS